jgi:hypothetical protein
MVVMITEHDAGLRIGGIVVRYNVPLPPPSGPARTNFCLVEGVAAFRQSLRNYGQALAIVGVHIPGGLSRLPVRYPLHEPHSEKRSKSVGRRRVERWFGLRNELDDLEAAARLLGSTYLGRDWNEGERAARAALGRAVEAFNWFDDVLQELGECTFFDLNALPQWTDMMGRGHVGIGALLDRVHELAHLAGELVGGLFGCKLVHEGDEWTKQCPLSVMHIRLGYSMGMTATYTCNICGEDPSECDHEPGEIYNVIAGRVGGECNICSASGDCQHRVGEDYWVRTNRTVTGGEIHEVSLVPRPRDPLARITSIGGAEERMRQRYGFVPTPDCTLLCHDCMYPCTGLNNS